MCHDARGRIDARSHPALVGGTAALLVSLNAVPSEADGEQRTNAGSARQKVLGVLRFTALRFTALRFTALRFTALRSNGDDRSDALDRLG
ncbi:hypothetical protein EYB53_012180 [Candidatus Chloroploca sp. M-50]|uniref:Uncharacterized protein n=1 Tax=Candidatus Chloroploca mongolica TaxID=2528176 RepID=A0ABS4DAH8_9CHLR|nr:hypothetical protein [Candidatus Chloroploca mongolica]MBP1466463.1 hypothetical protein [Candidatus Chloroploca mongolica]